MEQTFEVTKAGLNKMKNQMKCKEGADAGRGELERYLSHVNEAFNIFEVEKADKTSLEKSVESEPLQFGDFDIGMQIVDDVVTVDEPLVCRICISSEIFKLADIHLEIYIDGTLVDTLDKERVLCDAEHEIEIVRPKIAGDGKILFLTSPPGSTTGSKWNGKFLVKDIEEEAKGAPDFAEMIPGSFNEEEVKEINEIKEMAQEWQKWKTGLVTAGDSENIGVRSEIGEPGPVDTNPAFLEVDIYEDVLKVADKYMENAEQFVNCQLKDQIGVNPNTLALDNMIELAECMARSASLLIGREKATNMKKDILDVRSLYLFSSTAHHRKEDFIS